MCVCTVYNQSATASRSTKETDGMEEMVAQAFCRVQKIVALIWNSEKRKKPAVSALYPIHRGELFACN